MKDNNSMIVFVVFKVMRIVFSYVALLIAKNFTSQIYMEKVLVHGDNPPKLSNYIMLYMMTELLMSVIFLAMMYAADSAFELKLNENDAFTTYIIPDMIISTLFIVIVGMIVSNKMYEKKYFLYKDDGLRAIRALSEIMFSLSAFMLIIPFNFMTTGLIKEIKDMK